MLTYGAITEIILSSLINNVLMIVFVLIGTPDALIPYFCAALPDWKNESLPLMASHFPPFLL
jgi:hypothetical protein